MKKILLSVTLTIIVLFCVAQAPTTWTFSEIITEMPATSVPFDAKKKGVPFVYDDSYTIDNSNNVIPDRLYDNVQLTQYIRASISPELWGTTFRKFAIPNSSNTLLVVSFGGVTEWRTDVICVVTPSGQVLSTLECAIRVADIYVKQFRINEYNEIIVTSIIPTDTVSIPFETFTSFEGKRQDITYSIDASGQFVEESKGRIYGSRVYTRSYLEDESVNLWEGGETFKKPMNPPRRPRE
jgi:hypothetical protein